MSGIPPNQTVPGGARDNRVVPGTNEPATYGNPADAPAYGRRQEGPPHGSVPGGPGAPTYGTGAQGPGFNAHPRVVAAQGGVTDGGNASVTSAPPDSMGEPSVTEELKGRIEHAAGTLLGNDSLKEKGRQKLEGQGIYSHNEGLNERQEAWRQHEHRGVPAGQHGLGPQGYSENTNLPGSRTNY